MKAYPAIGVIDFSAIPVGVAATDGMLKSSPIAFVRCGTITAGRYLTVIGGTPAAVEEAMRHGLTLAGDAALDFVLLADVHHDLYEAMRGRRRTGGTGPLAIVETATAAASVRAAEAALKGTPVELVEIRLADSGLAGKGVAFYRGALHDLEAAVGLAVAAVEARRGECVHRIIAAPHEALAPTIDMSTAFASSRIVELDGERG